jgi:hypothetical protein
MIKLELEEHVVEGIMEVLLGNGSDRCLGWVEEIERQIPLAAPDGLFAIVETFAGVFYIRVQGEQPDVRPWRMIGDGQHQYLTSQLQIKAIHFSGITT